MPRTGSRFRCPRRPGLADVGPVARSAVAVRAGHPRRFRREFPAAPVNRRGPATRVISGTRRRRRRGHAAVINVIEVAVVWDDQKLFENLGAYAARAPDVEVRETSVASLLAAAGHRPDIVLVEVAPHDLTPGEMAPGEVAQPERPKGKGPLQAHDKKAQRERADPVADIRRLCRAGYRVLALSKSVDPYLSAALLGTGACLLLGRNQTMAAVIAAIRASGPVRSRPPWAAMNGIGGNGGRAATVGATVRGSRSRPVRPRLSQRERSVLVAYISGMTLDAVAERVGIRPSTAKTYLERVKAKYREIGRPAYTKLELAQRAHEEGSQTGCP